MTPEEFRQRLVSESSEDIVDQIILSDDPGPYTTREALLVLERKARAVFGLTDTHTLSTIVVGSAKLGFAMLDKRGENGERYKPAYRAYQPGRSDIDVAIVSQVLYGKIWQELARYGASYGYFPWRSDLSAYMLHGWLRPDKFPAGGPRCCVDWNELVDEVSRTEYFRYKKLRCGIFHSRYFLKIYQQRGVNTAKQAEQAI